MIGYKYQSVDFYLQYPETLQSKLEQLHFSHNTSNSDTNNDILMYIDIEITRKFELPGNLLNL